MFLRQKHVVNSFMKLAPGAYFVIACIMWLRESWLLWCSCAVTVFVCLYLPLGAMGPSAVCDCGISWPFLLTLFYFNMLSKP